MTGTMIAALWGLSGAFIYAAPRWMACAFASKGVALRCSLEMIVCLGIGSIAAAAFGPWVLVFLKQRPTDLGAISAMVGLLANPTAPKVVDMIGNLASSGLVSRIAKAVKGDDKA